MALLKVAPRQALSGVLALLLGLVGCSQRPNEDVRLVADGAHLVLENRSGGDIHHFMLPWPHGQAWLPVSLPGNRLEDGRRLRWRVAPSDRGGAIELYWWRPGKAYANTEIAGADRVRKIRITLEPLAEPLPPDEQLVRLCQRARAIVAREQAGFASVASQQAARAYSPRKAEADCMQLAEDSCELPQECSRQLQAMQHSLDTTQRMLAGRKP